ncbi:MAG: serine hydrolase domain-containing protein [Planctomycetota bacterium]
MKRIVLHAGLCASVLLLNALPITHSAVPSAHSRGCEAAELNANKLSTIRTRMQQFVDEKQIAGAVTVVGNSRGVQHLEAVGQADIDAARAMSRDTVFRIASMTKPITGMAVMMLVDEGKLAIEDPVEKHLPEFRGQLLTAQRTADLVQLKKPSRPITVRDLLTHTSGLPGGFPTGVGDLYGKRHLTLAEAVLVSSQQPLDFEPGSKWAYCNAGIDTLGRMVEVLSGKPFAKFCEERIFTPLGMRDTTFFPNDEQLSRAAIIYQRTGDVLQAVAKPLIGSPRDAKHPIPAGGLFSTGPDLAKLYQALLHKGRLGDVVLLKAATCDVMTSVHTGELNCGFVPGTGFGLGCAIVRQPTGVTEMLKPGTYGHGGAFGTQGWIDPAQDLFVILLIQRSGLPNGDASEMRRELQRLAVEALQ